MITFCIVKIIYENEANWMHPDLFTGNSHSQYIFNTENEY